MLCFEFAWGMHMCTGGYFMHACMRVPPTGSA